MKHHITEYIDCSDNKRYCESWLQVNAFGKCFCFSRRKMVINDRKEAYGNLA